MKTIVWLAGHVLLERGFAQDLAKFGAKAIASEAKDTIPLTEVEQRAVDATTRLPLMRLVIWAWWRLYDFHRALGLIPDAHAREDPWWV